MKAGPSVVVDKYFDLELPKFNKYMDYLLWVLFKFLEVFHINLLRSTDADFKENVIFYDGYWQNNKFYDRDNKWLKMKLPQDIGQRNWKILKEMKSTNSVSIHVRRGDYLKIRKFMVLIRKHIIKMLSQNKRKDGQSCFFYFQMIWIGFVRIWGIKSMIIILIGIQEIGVI